MEVYTRLLAIDSLQVIAGSETVSQPNLESLSMLLTPWKTAITIHCFFLMMARYPEVQRKAQAEIVAVCGRDRLPTFTDREHLPYVEAVIKEVTRMHPSVPIGMPNSASS